jgi:neutral ceramidase
VEEEMNRRASFTLLGVLCCPLLAATSAPAAEPGPAAGAAPAYRVGLARACTTPEEPLWMAGYRPRNHASEGVLDDLFAQALAIEDAGGRRGLLLCVDVCSMRKSAVEDVCRRIGGRTGLKREQILVNVSHTHSGPAVGLTDVYSIPPDGREKLAAYAGKLESQLVDLAEAAVKDLKPAQLAFGKGTARFFENRRRLDAKGRWTGMGPNPKNHVDRDVPVLRVSAPGGKARALIFGAACHNVTLGQDSYKISGDYAGFARMHVEDQLPGVQAVFVTGCGADANPEPRSTADQEQWTRRHGESLGAEVLKVASGQMQPVAGPLRTEFAFVDLPLQKPLAREELEKLLRQPDWKSHQAGLMLAALDRGETLPATYAAPISVWQFGGRLTLVGLPEETVSEYVSLLKRALGADGLWTAGYCNDVSGYLPTVKILNEGGYETRGLFAPNIGWFAPEVEKEIVDAVCRLAEQAGRKAPPGLPKVETP